MPTIITKIKVQNFKTFQKNELELKKLNLIIGLNASGKSNLIALFKFLRDIVSNGLDNAISLQGGIEYLLNSKFGIRKNLLIDIEILPDKLFFEVPLKKSDFNDFGIKVEEQVKQRKSLFINIDKTKYCFELKFLESQEYVIITDSLISSGVAFIADESIHKEKLKIKNKKNLGNIEFCSSYKEGFLNFQMTSSLNEKAEKKIKDVFNPRRPIKVPEKSLILEAPYFIESPIVDLLLKKLVIYDIDPKLSKKGAFISGKKDLEEDGGNLALVIKNIIKDDAKKSDFNTLVNDILPFVDGFDVDTFAGKNLIFKMKEKYDLDYWPASFLSDGTINVISLIIANNFAQKPLMIFEEPEKNIHPMLIPKILQLFKDASNESQIIITSHNPEFVKHADIKDILFIKRNENGNSEIIKPSELKKVKSFLEGELSLDSLFVRNLIGD